MLQFFFFNKVDIYVGDKVLESTQCVWKNLIAEQPNETVICDVSLSRRLRIEMHFA